jgi:hypothetical protein
MNTELLPVSTIIKDFGLSKYMIYKTIKIDSSFPARNIGPKKNFRIDLNEFIDWFSRRTTLATTTAIPTGEDLLKDMKNAKH